MDPEEVLAQNKQLGDQEEKDCLDKLNKLMPIRLKKIKTPIFVCKVSKPLHISCLQTTPTFTFSSNSTPFYQSNSIWILLTTNKDHLYMFSLRMWVQQWCSTYKNKKRLSRRSFSAKSSGISMLRVKMITNKLLLPS
jgi:hypothetical protein